VPTVKKGEEMKDYLSRCIPTVAKEHPELSHKAVVGRCAGMFKGEYGMKKKTKKSKAKAGTPAGYKAGLSGQKIRSKGKGRGLGRGKGRGPIGVPYKRSSSGKAIIG